MQKKQIRLGFIGLGEHQQRAHVVHLRTLQREGISIELVKGFDPDLAAFDLSPELECCADESGVILDPHIDAVFIASPDKYHAKQLLAAVQAGKHVFCEKPMAVTGEDLVLLEQALNLASEKGLVVTTCHPRRFDPPCMWLQKNLPELQKEFGALKTFNFLFWYHKVTDLWKMEERSLLTDHFGHEIDIMRFLLGDGDIAIRSTQNSYDCYETLGTFRAGAGTTENIGFKFYGSRHLEESVYKEAIQLDFERGSFFMHLNEGLGVSLRAGQDFSFPDLGYRLDTGIFTATQLRRFPAMDYDVRFLDTNRDFVNAILEGSAPYLCHNDIRCNNSLTVLLAGPAPLEAAWPALSL